MIDNKPIHFPLGRNLSVSLVPVPLSGTQAIGLGLAPPPGMRLSVGGPLSPFFEQSRKILLLIEDYLHHYHLAPEVFQSDRVSKKWKELESRLNLPNLAEVYAIGGAYASGEKAGISIVFDRVCYILKEMQIAMKDGDFDFAIEGVRRHEELNNNQNPPIDQRAARFRAKKKVEDAQAKQEFRQHLESTIIHALGICERHHHRTVRTNFSPVRIEEMADAIVKGIEQARKNHRGHHYETHPDRLRQSIMGMVDMMLDDDGPDSAVRASGVTEEIMAAILPLLNPRAAKLQKKNTPNEHGGDQGRAI